MEMKADDVVSIYMALDSAGVKTWIDGGWAVDALIGTQTRSHGDLDVAIRSTDVSALRSCLVGVKSQICCKFGSA